MSVNVQNPVYPSEALALSGLASKWRSTDLNVGMYLSPEGKESATMVGDSLLRLANSARALRRGDFGGFVRNLNSLPRSSRRASARRFEQGDVSGSFLAAHLGWEPLIKDVWNLSENIAPIPKRRRVSGGAKGRYDLKLFQPYFTGYKFSKYSKAETRFLMELEPPTFAQRFGLDNPFMIAWGLKPLSFVADYFLPIGATIDALGFLGQNFKARGWRKQVAIYRYSSTVLAGADLGQGTFVTVPATHSQSSLTYSRKPYVPSLLDPLRSLNVTVPESLMRISTLAALTHQRLLSLEKPFKR